MVRLVSRSTITLWAHPQIVQMVEMWQGGSGREGIAPPQRGLAAFGTRQAAGHGKESARALAYRHKNRKGRLDRRHSTTFQLSR
jgi:hypothetical protein